MPNKRKTVAKKGRTSSLEPPHNQGRRKFLKQAAGISALTAASPALLGESPDLSPVRPHGVKNCIVLVVDGMGRGTLSTTNEFSLNQTGQELNWLKLLKDKNVSSALQNTASQNSRVTDSAAASSAWASGQRIPNGRINVTAEGKELEPVFKRAKAHGKAIGLVSTTRITHATPASFVASVKDRNDELSIAQQYLDQEIDLLMGGGSRYFNQEDSQLLKAFQASGYTCVDSVDALLANEKRTKLLGLFAESHLPYAIDRKYAKQHFQVPSLSAMFRIALNNLSQNEAGFCLQVEAGRVDHAGHAKDVAAIVEEQLEFDQCIPIAVDFVDQNPDTLLIITTDHGTGGCQFNGFGEAYGGSNLTMRRISKIRASFESLAESTLRLNRADRNLFRSQLGINLSSEDASVIQSMLEGDYRIQASGYRDTLAGSESGFQHDYLAANLSSYFESYFFKHTGIGWTSNAHTAELVDLIAYGAESESLPKYIQNYELCALIRNALKI
ncbi:MAG: hypothetical protein CML12_01005 [Puniceicoccaceae bacterium]|nr:hypothetical protein [Puniceicoccaceae bacterium]